MMDLAARGAVSEGPLLILGESGVGKETLARRIHKLSPRAARPLLGINCAGLPEHMFQEELFGGPTGTAGSTRGGLARAARAGALVLSEIGELSMPIQQLLLDAMAQGAFDDVGLMADTNRNLDDEVVRGHFLPELLAMVSGMVLRIPALRERRSEILPLARAFLADEAGKVGREVPAISEAAAAALEDYSYPGNVRELWLYMCRASLLCEDPLITPQHLPFRLR
jgi:DNA-binding NtrC family response regulator